ncbi:MAG: serine/threonine-protein kinase [Planctomycetota bacterium]|nr:serine/threonine-protein kinase [Planctomycetota bacterium]
MTQEQQDAILAEALEDYHRQRARGERPDEVVFQKRLGDLYPEFAALVAAETLIDEALEPTGEAAHLPIAWGSYTLLREIARGAAGVVYEAIHRKLGRKVALKVLRTGVDTDANARERFQREAQALAQVKHDHIVEIYEFGEVDGRPYYAMSLVDGPTLADLVKQDRLPDPATLCRGLAGVADALVTLHAAGIIHRDVKPSNIMVDSQGRYMLADFGLARSAMSTTMTRSGDALGTPLYMSPEQMLGNRSGIEERTDVYGLGATMYQLLTGAPPFRTDNLHALMRMVLKERPEHPRSIAPDLPPGCSRIALQCLEKDARDRYGSAAELRDDLLRFADGARVSGRPLTMTQRGLRAVRRHPVLALAACVLVALGITWAAQPNDPIQLRVTTTPIADIEIVGDPRRFRSPLEIDLPSDRDYTVFVHSPDPAIISPGRLTVKGEPGLVKESVLLRALNLEGHLYIDRENAKLRAAGYTSAGQERGHRAEFVFENRYPRGPVRSSDLAAWSVAVGTGFAERFPAGARLVFDSGEHRLHDEAFPEPERSALSGAIPQTVLDALKPGMTVTWGLARAAGEPIQDDFSASFEVVERDVGDVLERIEQAVASMPESSRAVARATLRGEVFLHQGLPAAAWESVDAFVTGDRLLRLENGEASIQSAVDTIAVKREAVIALFPGTKARSASEAWREVAEDIGLYSDSAWAAYRDRLERK